MADHTSHQHDGRRVEDIRLITGAGKYAADWNAAGQLHGHFVRADRAHAHIVTVNTSAALSHPGVMHVFTGIDAVNAGYTKVQHSLTFPGRNGMKALAPSRPALAHGAVHFVGEAIALVVATSAAAARDAADLVQVEYRDLPCAIQPEQALAAGAPQIYDDVPGNLAFEFEAGNAQAVADAFAKAAHVTRLKVESTRVAPSPMEPRACLVAYDAASGEYRFNVCMQGVTTLRKQISTYAHVAEDKLVFEVRDVGGGFGQRTPVYPEYCALMLAAKALGKPVKWISSRVEGFLTDTHGRGNIIDAALALDGDGKFLALRMDWVNDVGAYLSPGPLGHIRNTMMCMTGVYRIPALYASYRVALTNTAPVSSYRGAGRPDIAYAVERIVNHAAAELGIDAVELKRRNFIPPQAFPYKTPTGSTYDNAERLCAAPRADGGGRQTARARHFDRDRKYRHRAAGRNRTQARRRRHGHRAYRHQIAGAGTRDDAGDDRCQHAGHTAGAGQGGAMHAGHHAQGQSYRRLAQHGGRRRSMSCRGAKAD
jgi:aerobic carbon-monoxide dehydrogenase large subunit